MTRETMDNPILPQTFPLTKTPHEPDLSPPRSGTGSLSDDAFFLDLNNHQKPSLLIRTEAEDGYFSRESYNIQPAPIITRPKVVEEEKTVSYSQQRLVVSRGRAESEDSMGKAQVYPLPQLTSSAPSSKQMLDRARHYLGSRSYMNKPFSKGKVNTHSRKILFGQSLWSSKVKSNVASRMKGDELLPLRDLRGARLQQRVFARWINIQLQDTDKKVENLIPDLLDGTVLVELVQALTGDKLLDTTPTPSSTAESVSNLQVVLPAEIHSEDTLDVHSLFTYLSLFRHAELLKDGAPLCFPEKERSRGKTEGTKVTSALALVGVGAGIKSLSHLVNEIIG
eukprot:sb/3466484/